MHWRRNRWSSFCGVAIAVAMACVVSERAVCQDAGAGVAGIAIDAEGVLRTRIVSDPRGVVAQQRIREARSKLGAELVRPSRLRKVSLNRLEEAIKEALESGEPLSAEMSNLAGMTSIEYVFFYPESNDIVIAGPAEGFYENAAGRNVGIVSGKATLQLEDLIVALRAYAPQGRNPGQIGCSIDPTQEGLQRMQAFLSSLRGIQPSDANRIAAGLRENLGLQTVSVHGISPNTHFAQVLVEADYRMKLIGIGLEPPRARFDSYVARANPRQVSRNAMQRWYFTPNYECLMVSEDNLAMQLVGDRVKLISEDEFVAASGARNSSGTVNRASEAFCNDFTRHYNSLAEKTPVYAQLANLIDMTITAAFIQHQDYYGMSGWDLGVFGDEELLPVETHAAPSQVESAVNVVWKGQVLMTPIGGGVEILASRALESSNIQEDARGQVAKQHDEVAEALEATHWWWD